MTFGHGPVPASRRVTRLARARALAGSTRAGAVALGVALALALAAPRAVRADEPRPSAANTCEGYGGQGAPCANDTHCADHIAATRCVRDTAAGAVAGTCQVPCQQGTVVDRTSDPAACAVGETCTLGAAAPSGDVYWCKPTRFRMDLNLVDACIAHFVNGVAPVFGDNACSLEANLSRLLDQDGDQQFTIFDVDLCVLSFLEQPGCRERAGQWQCDDPADVPCASDDACGAGLYCDIERHICQRECGFVAAREESFGALERQCAGALRACEYERGRCLSVDPARFTCEVDRDCPSGAYCFLGRCAPTCYRVTDCPGSSWYCAPTNRCRALPGPDAPAGATFDPRNYAVRFGRDALSLDAVQTVDRSPIVVIDLLTKRQVVGNSALAFGYRLETSYDLKQDKSCLRPFVDCDEDAQRPSDETADECRARQSDCFIDDSEQWLRLPAPFGTVAATGSPGLSLALETAVAETLTPGTYTATVRAIYDNGDSDSIRVTYTRTSPSGEYVGSLSVYLGSPDNSLTGRRPLAFDLRLKMTGETVRWNELMDEQNLAFDDGDESGFVDETSGTRVLGALHGSDAFAFTNGSALGAGADEIPFVGIYSPRLGAIRLIGVIDLAGDFCLGATGACASGDTQLQVRNPFGRDLRRTLLLTGPFDARTGTFSGVYREKLDGLVPGGALTLEGTFSLQQTLADDSRMTQSQPLVPAGDAGVLFLGDALGDGGSYDALVDDVASDAAAWCSAQRAARPSSTDAAVATYDFSRQERYEDYLTDDAARWGARVNNPLGRNTIFPTLVRFDDVIQSALASLGTTASEISAADTRNYLNVYDYVDDWVVPCDDADPQPPPVCIDEAAVRCGLGLHQAAMLEGWIDAGAVSDRSNQTLQCPDTIDASGCAQRPGSDPSDRALFGLQEHNRFWFDLAKILKFEADRARSNAFLVLFRNEVNPFAAGAALTYKRDQLRVAYARYDELVSLLAGPAPSAVLWNWPARAFTSGGRLWLDTMHTILADRMDVLAELVDLERRVFLGTGTTDFVFAQHLMQYEYLLQVWVMALQRNWQRESFAYRGEASPIFQQGQLVLSQLNPAKNTIGVTPGLVAFESQDPTRTNWENYHDELVGRDGRGGLIADARALSLGAVTNLKSALADLDTLERKLQNSRYALDDRLADVCGDPDPGDTASSSDTYCQELLKRDLGESELGDALECLESGESCADSTYGDAVLEYTCADGGPDALSDDRCDRVVASFVSTVGDTAARCALDEADVTVEVNGLSRPCVGGRMGALLQDRETLLLKRLQVLGRLRTLVERLDVAYTYTTDTHDSLKRTADFTYAGNAVQTLGNYATDLYHVAEISLLQKADTSNCIVIAGTAVGTNCPQKTFGQLAKAVVSDVFGFAYASAVEILRLLSNLATYLGDLKAIERWVWAQQAQIDQLAAELGEISRAFELLTQDIFNAEARIDDLRFQAQHAIDRYSEEVGFVASHLVGRESGYVLLGDHLVGEASTAFRDIVDRSYRMAVAFDHAYNLSPGDAQTLINAALALVTLDDAEAFVATLEARSRDYCGLAGIDCDAANNVSVLRYSVRENLFPQLRDVVDGRTGQVVTAGAQFNSIIQQPPYLTRRVRGTVPVDQIELPIAIPATMKENTADGTPRWLIDPLSCNQLLDGRDPAHPVAGQFSVGNVAVNVLGRNLGGGERPLKYELVRGPIDFIRACEAQSVIEEAGTLPVLQYPIRRHLVGYATQNLLAQRTTPPSYFSRSTPFAACLGAPEDEAGVSPERCWHFFARDRSLASPDWKLVVPLYVDGGATESAWVTGAGLPEQTRPEIEDIVLYFRYRSRPIQEP